MKKTLRAVLAALMLALWMGCALGEEAKAPLAAVITPEEAALTIQAAGGLEKLGVDKQLQFTAAFAAPDKINKKNGNSQVRWSLVMAPNQMLDWVEGFMPNRAEPVLTEA